jgi:predicted Na+-dependent transporter
LTEPVSIHFSSGSLGALNIYLAIIMFGPALDIKVEHFTQWLNQKKAVLTGLFSQIILRGLFTVAFDFRLCLFSHHAQTTYRECNSVVMKE